MFCKKCGRQIEESDAFCPYCGEPIPKEEIVSRRVSSAAHNPEFHWNVKDEFPEPRKRETMEFNWTSGEMTPRREQRPAAPAPAKPVETDWRLPEERPVRSAPQPKEPEIPSWLAPKGEQKLPEWLYEEISPKRAEERKPVETDWTLPEEKPVRSAPLPTEPVYTAPLPPEPVREPEPPKPAAAEKPQSPVERRILRDVESAEEAAWTRQEEKFYTFTRKNEEFQKLLDREYEKVRRNGTPVERPLSRTETVLPPREEPKPADTPRPVWTEAPKAEPAKPEPVQIEPPKTEPKPAAVPEAPKAEKTPEQSVIPKAVSAATIAFVRPEATAPEEPTIRIPGVGEAEELAETALPKTARPEPTITLTPGPEEIRTIWEEIKADMERENQARAAEETVRKEAAETKSPAPETPAAVKEPADSEPKPAHSRESLSATATAPRTTGEVEAVTATALTKIWETEEEEAEIPQRRGHFWLVLFLILVLILMAILADIALQKFWPDTGAAAFAKDAEDWVLGVWEDLKALFEK